MSAGEELGAKHLEIARRVVDQARARGVESPRVFAPGPIAAELYRATFPGADVVDAFAR